MQAFNDVGASEFSEPSLLYQFKGTFVSSDNTLTVIVSALIVFCSVMTVFLVYGMLILLCQYLQQLFYFFFHLQSAREFNFKAKRLAGTCPLTIFLVQK